MKHFILQTKAVLKASLLFILFLSAVSVVKAQSNTSLTGMTYQTIVRNNSGALVNGYVGIQIKILQGSATGNTVYTETQRPYANVNGLASIIIGSANPTGFSTIPWASGPFYLETDIDASGGTNYQFAGTNQLMSVPYALYAASSGSSTGSLPTGTTKGQVLYYDGTTWIKLNPPSQNGAALYFCDIPTWGGCPLPSGSITTAAVAGNTTGYTATVGGAISNTNASNITGTGVLLYTGANPSPTDKPSNPSPTTGNYTISLTGLTPGTTYSYKAYAVIGTGVNAIYSYGNLISFTTPATPTVITAAMGNITYSSAVLNGNVTADGGSAVTKGFVYYTTSTAGVYATGTVGYSKPGLLDITTYPNSTATTTGTGIYSTNLNTGITQNTQYFVRAYATNTVGTTYGDEVTFSTPINVIIPTVSFSTASNSNVATIFPLVSQSSLSQIAINLKSSAIATGTNITSCGFKYSTDNGATWNWITNTLTPSNFSINLNNDAGSPIQSLVVKKTTQTILLQAVATNSAGTGSQQISIVINTLAVSNLFAGGVIVYLNPDGSGGTVASTSSIGPLPYLPGQTYLQNYSQVGGGVIGTNQGMNLTTQIASSYTTYYQQHPQTSPALVQYATAACLTYSGNNFSNWYLPTNTEMSYLKSVASGSSTFYDLPSGNYWTCIEYYSGGGFSAAGVTGFLVSNPPNLPLTPVNYFNVVPFRQFTY